MTAAPSTILPEQAEHAAAIETLLDAAFGPGRFAKTAYRLRAGTRPVAELSFVALLARSVIGSVRFSPITIGPAQALLLGPLVIHPDHKNRGHGVALMRASLDAARDLGHRLVILVGDAPYYARVGFTQVPPGRIRLPGPVDPARLLAFELVDGALADARGLARPARASAPLAEPGAGQRGEEQGKADEPREKRQLADAQQD